MDKQIRQQERFEVEDMTDAMQSDDEQEESLPVNIPQEFVKFKDSRLGYEVFIGSTSQQLSYLCELALWLKSQWNRTNVNKPKDKKEGTYIG